MIIKKKAFRKLSSLKEKIKGFNGYSSLIGTTNEIEKITWLKNTLSSLKDGSSILDAGAGELQFKTFCKHLVYTSQDFGQYDGKGDNIGLHTQKWDNSKLDIVSDITNIPVEDSKFDAVMCIEVLEHVPDPWSALIELNRVLKKGGKLIITAPFASLTHFSPYHFSTGFNKFFYEEFSKRNNYKILDLKANGGYFDYMAQELRRIEFIAENYCESEKDADIRDIIDILLQKIANLKKTDKRSHELLTCGYFYFGEKL